MKEWTPVRILNHVQRELWRLIRLLNSVEVQLAAQSETRVELAEVQKVLRAMIVELGRIVGAEAKKVTNQRNIRQAEDFALKAQLAKARQAVASVLEEREDEPSHK
jgi:hypothetical protein